IDVHALAAEHPNGCIANSVCGQPRHEVATEAEVGQAYGDVRFPSAECGVNKRRLEQALVSRGAQAKQDLAEGDRLLAHHRSPRAARRALVSRRACSATWAKSPRATAAGSTRLPPTPTATAPAARNAPAFSAVTPPVGTRRSCGSGPRRSLT